jgi:hypothetical protein
VTSLYSKKMCRLNTNLDTSYHLINIRKKVFGKNSNANLANDSYTRHRTSQQLFNNVKIMNFRLDLV